MGYNPQDDITLKADFKIYWDGECKNGFAYGLGREFVKAIGHDAESIAVYHGGKQEPDYYYEKEKLQNITALGDINKRQVVATKIQNKAENFDIGQINNIFDEKNGISYIMVSSALSPNKTLIKKYPNFSFKILDFSNNNFDNRKIKYGILDKNNNANGFAFEMLKNGEIIGAEFKEGLNIRNVALPQSYIQKGFGIYNEIVNNLKLVNPAYEKAMAIKVQYKKKICNDTHKVSFIENTDYREICNEDKELSKIQLKIQDKLKVIQEQQKSNQEYELEKMRIQNEQSQIQNASDEIERQKALDAFKNFADNYQESSRQQLNSVINMPVPQV